MKRLSSVALGLCLALGFGQSEVLSKGGRRQGNDSARGNASGSALTQNSHTNGQASADRDFGKERATEVGRGKEKGLHKDQYSIGEGHEKNQNRSAVEKKHKEKDKEKKQN